jgi:hypothetical protein
MKSKLRRARLTVNRSQKNGEKLAAGGWLHEWWV